MSCCSVSSTPAQPHDLNKTIDPAEKRLINCSAVDVNQLMPLKYHWAWEHYLNGCSNHWMPQEVPMTKDIELWKSNNLSEAERRVIMRNLGFFSTAESLVANNIVLAIFVHITNPEARQYLLRQAFEEAIHCYIEGTEILTENGFMDFRDLHQKTRVAQYHKDGSISFTVTDEIHSDDFTGDMVRFSNERYHSVVTPKHRCVVTDPRKNHDMKIVLAEDLCPSNYNIPVAGKAVGTERLFTVLDRFSVAFQADGHVLNSEDGDQLGSVRGQIAVSFQFKKQRKIDRILQIAEDLEWEYSTKPAATNPDHTVVKVKVPIEYKSRLVKGFEWLNFPEVNAMWAAEFLLEVDQWDGCPRPGVGKCRTYTNTNKKAIDTVQVLAALSGQRTNLYTVPVEGNRSPAWQVTVSSKSHVSGKTLGKEEVPYSGKVYCVGVPTGMIITRYNGKVTVSGNTHAFHYITESLALDTREVFNAYHEINSIKNKDEFEMTLTADIMKPGFTTETLEGKQKFLKNLIGFYIIMEGIFFYSGFAMILSFQRQNRMTGIGEQFQYILRDESTHLNFGIDLINGIKEENPEIWTTELQEEIYTMIATAVDLERQYARDCLPTGILGLNASQFDDYVRNIADRRLERIGLHPRYHTKNPFPWLSEAIDIKKEKNFFETRVTEYQAASSLKWN